MLVPTSPMLVPTHVPSARPQEELAPWGSGGSPPRTWKGRSRSALTADRDRPIARRGDRI
ncbi:hypothetical protein UO65_5180 [Actinokineospora spheciospongiae]|uniref:Uncharacterized protein n=1 Tax=Actinokineospora spheciospongiae TaxID=909613 RepID=W7IRU5_9PSEU|nr:hypothetical protein UO65_5180 [Actinokineospora spheciospongiae]